MSIMVSLDQFKAGFLTECTELLTDMESMLVELTPETADKDTLGAIFRCAHSIKGGSGAFGLDAIMHFTHILEALLDAMREDRVPISTEAVDALLQSVDIVTTMVECAKLDVAPSPDLGKELVGRLERLSLHSLATPTLNTPQARATSLPATTTQEPCSFLYHINFKSHPTLFLSGNEPLLILQELSNLGEATITADTDAIPPLESINPTSCYMHWTITLHSSKCEADIREVFEFVEDQCDLSIRADTRTPSPSSTDIAIERSSPAPAASKNKTPPSPEGQAAFGRRVTDNQVTTIRVDLDKVDKLVNIVGELVITEAMIKAQINMLPADVCINLQRGVDELSHHTRELQEAVMSVRMQPVKSIFARMPRIVRDLSAQLGKDIVLHMEGENTEVDKTVIEQLGDPITHMIRNSVDHGVETPEMRIAAGKPAQGTITLSAFHQGGRIIIEIRDDGKGINRERVLAKAKEKGLFPPDAIISDEECDNIIFMAGFSTAEVVSNVSGRGVGMDVVRRNIEAVNGTVSVKSDYGKGSVFTISLPLTLAILDGMIVRVGAEFYVIPITSIIETMRPKKQEIRHVDGNCDVINVRGEFIPITYLHEIFYIQGAERDPSNALVVLVEAGKDKLGIVVDELVGQQQVVIKSLESNTDPIKGISGATILGDGKVSLILEMAELKQLSQSHHSPRIRQEELA